MIAALKPYVPDIIREYRQATEQTRLTRLGAFGVNMYYCTDYMAPLHEDSDKCISLCCQLEKSGCADGVLDFAYAKYGLIIETRTNTAW